MKIQVLGITGPTGAGKSLLCRELTSRGIPVIDADEVYHSLLIPPSPCLTSLRHAFGNGIFGENGTLNRQALSEIVFHDEEKLRLLNATVLHFVLERIREMIRQLSSEGKRTVAVDGPTLIESGFHRECDRVVAVLAPLPLRKERIMQRDALSEEQASARIAAQKPDDFYRTHSHCVLTNDGDSEAFLHRVSDLLQQLDIHP
ncbi:MAG: dephospho-CoA kinase [Clostridia bacterium]|nr:dephospho-CoA kinase [Clostridia bacterium]